MKNDFGLEKGNFAKRKNIWLSRLLKVAGILVVLAIIFLFVFLAFRKYNSKITVKDIKAAWKTYDYQSVYELSKSYLSEVPYSTSALAYYAYACFYLSQSQTDTQQAQFYLDESINSLRIALYSANKSLTPQLQYMLGRAYFYKNTITTHYYADLAVKYLLMAKKAGYVADDIAEYLGLSYASLGMTMESISAFTEALLVRESDALLLSIAEQYTKALEYQAAQQYLYRIINSSQNDEIIVKSRNLLGNIYIFEEKYDEALKEFENVLEKNANSADAHYGIGVIYEYTGNMVKARAEWRQALKIQPNHSDALKKMSES